MSNPKGLSISLSHKLEYIFTSRFVVYVAIIAIACVINTTITVIGTTPVALPVPPAFIPAVFARDPSNSAVITWTAPGDDGIIGQATRYDIRYSASPLSESNWNEATEIENPPLPATAGTTENFIVDQLLPKTTYYFGLKAYDEAGNVSGLSNIATGTTSCTEVWSCSGWSDCIDGQKSRTCIDNNDCGTTLEKPSETMACYVTPPCQENWQCTDWSACESGSQSRTCTDANACGTTLYKPGETQECEAGGEIIGIQETYIVVVPNAGGGPQVRIFDKTGRLISQFFAYEENFRGGLNVAVGDLGTDGIDEVVVAPGPGREPTVKIFTSSGQLIKQFNAFDKSFRGGVNVAVGELNTSDGKEIVVAPASNYRPVVRIFGLRNGEYTPVFDDIMAYASNFKGEVSVAVADLDANGLNEIITVPGINSGGPHVRIFEAVGGKFQTKILGFMAYQTQFRGGVSFATGDIEGDGFSDILTAPMSRGGPHVRFFGRLTSGRIGLKSPGYFVFSPQFRGGISIAAGDFDYNQKDEVVAAVRSGDQALIRIFRADGRKIYYEFKAFPEKIKTGIKIATGHFFTPQ